MNWQESQEYKEFYRYYEEPSRADFALGGIVLAFFAALLGTNLNTSPDLGSTVVRVVVALALGIGATICLASAVRRESGNGYLVVQPVKVETQERGRLAARSRRSA